MPADAGSPVERERPGCVLGIALGLAVLIGLCWFLVTPKTEARDGAQLLAAWFREPPAAPFEVRDAGKLMGGEEVVQLADALAAEERPRAEPTAPDGPGPRKVDWARVERGPADRPPRTLTFVRFPQERAAAEKKRLFSDTLAIGRLDEIGPGGGRMVLELGTLALAGRSPAYVVEREFERGGTFRDIVRVDLSAEGDTLVLNAIWSRSEPYSKRRLEELVAGLRRQ
jgi:hypothetical protein